MKEKIEQLMRVKQVKDGRLNIVIGNTLYENCWLTSYSYDPIHEQLKINAMPTKVMEND